MNKQTQKTMFSSNSNEWHTPQEFFDRLEERFGKFDLDAAATSKNSKCSKFYTIEDDALKQNWFYNTFCNPPYGRTLKDWIKKGYQEGQRSGNKIVMLVPARTDTKYFHNYCMLASQIIFVEGRIKFENDTGCINSAPFPSMVLVFEPNPDNLPPRFSTMRARLGKR